MSKAKGKSVTKTLSMRKKSHYEIKAALNPPYPPKARDSLICDSDAYPSAPRPSSTSHQSTVLHSANKCTEAAKHTSLSPLPPSIKNTNNAEPDNDLFPTIETGTLIKEKQVTRTMTIALATVNNMRAVQNDDTKEQLVDYIRKIFDSNEKTLRELWNEAADTCLEKPADKLVINVKCGSGLIPKDTNSKSDLFVRVGIIDGTRQQEAVVRSKNLTDWQKERGIMLTGEIKESSVRGDSATPQWDEQIELLMSFEEKETLVVEVWNSGELTTASKTLKDKLLNKTDDFMSRAFLSLWSVGGRVEDKVLELCSHSGKHKRGTVTVDLTKNIDSIVVGMSENLELTRAIVNYEGCAGGEYQRKWSGELSEEAEKLLDSHAQFYGLRESHKAAIRLSILMKYHRMFAVKMSTFSGLIKKIVSLESEIKALYICSSPTKDAPAVWLSKLFKDLYELVLEIEGILQNHLTVFDTGDPEDIARIQHRVDILVDLYTFQPFVDQLPSEMKDLHTLLEKSIQKAVPKWFDQLSLSLLPMDCKTPEMHLSAFKTFISHVPERCKSILECLHPIFERAGVDYFTEFYLTLDKPISAETKSRLETQESPDNVTMYEVYRTMKEIRKMMSLIDKRRHCELSILQFHTWFGVKVNHWISLATKRCKDGIKQAIQLDKIVQVTDDVQFSSSAVDSSGFLFRLMKVYKELEWPAKEAFDVGTSIVRSVCDCALYYVGEVYGSLRNEDMFDEQGRFRATERLSIVLNNMEHIKQLIVKHLKQELGLEVQRQGCQEAIGQEESEESTEVEQKGLVIQRQDSTEPMEALIQASREEIDEKILDIISQITQKMSPEVARLTGGILESKPSTVSLETIDPLMTYMATNLEKFGNHLLTPVFQLLLQNTWRVSNDCLITFVNQGSSRKISDPVQYYTRLKFILQTLKELYHAEGDGLSQDELKIEEHEELSLQLEILCLQTDKLILKFFSDLASTQAAIASSREAKLGNMSMSVGYNQEKEMVELQVIQANNLPGLAKSGLIDPLVKFTLMPYWVFGENKPKKQRTTTKKKTVNPVFKEDFLIPAPKESLQTVGSVLLLAVFHHHSVSSNDLCGICIVPCVDIPFLSPVSSALDNPNTTERKNLTLPLLAITESTIALRELNVRAQASDPKAIEFFKNNKHILTDVVSVRKYSFSSGRPRLVSKYRPEYT